jgi:hypothetical protein
MALIINRQLFKCFRWPLHSTPLFANQFMKPNFRKEVNKMGCDIEYDPVVEARIAQNQHDREKARREQELAYGREVFAALKDLPREKLPEDELAPFVRGILERSQRIADALPQLNGLDMNDSLGRNWQVSINKSEGTNSVWGISFRRMSSGWS